MRIQGCVAFVTGANRGLGKSFVDELLARGATKVYAGVRTLDSPLPNDSRVIRVILDVTSPASVASAAARCADVTVLVNNAGIARVSQGALDPDWVATAREIFETNFYGVVLTTQAFAPVVTFNGSGAIVNVLSDVAWHSPPALSAYAASKSAAWSFTNAARAEMRESGTRVLGLHVGFIDTDMTESLDVQKTSPRDVASSALSALEAGADEALADEGTRLIKQTFSGDQPRYLEAPAVWPVGRH